MLCPAKWQESGHISCPTELPYLPETMESLFIILHPILPGGETLRELHVGEQHL